MFNLSQRISPNVLRETGKACSVPFEKTEWLHHESQSKPDENRVTFRDSHKLHFLTANRGSSLCTHPSRPAVWAGPRCFYQSPTVWNKEVCDGSSFQPDKCDCVGSPLCFWAGGSLWGLWTRWGLWEGAVNLSSLQTDQAWPRSKSDCVQNHPQSLHSAVSVSVTQL